MKFVLLNRSLKLLLCLHLLTTLSFATHSYAADSTKIEELIKRAGTSAAAKTSLQCLACHNAAKGAKEVKLGPNLWGIVDRPIASIKDYEYSLALSELTGRWNSQQLDIFLSSPEKFAPGTKMTLPGIEDLNTRAHIIRYLYSLNDEPRVFAKLSAGESDLSAPDPFGDSWPAGQGRELVGHTCNVCHSLAIVKQQGQTHEGWSELIEWMIDEQGMSELDLSDKETIVDYLATHFNTDSKRD